MGIGSASSLTRWVATTAMVVTAIVTTIGAWHVHPAGDHDAAVSTIREASLTAGHECPACALAHAPTTAATPTSIVVVPDRPEARFDVRVPQIASRPGVSGTAPRGPPLSV